MRQIMGMFLRLHHSVFFSKLLGGSCHGWLNVEFILPINWMCKLI